MSGDILMIGTAGDHAESGSAHIFERIPGTQPGTSVPTSCGSYPDFAIFSRLVTAACCSDSAGHATPPCAVGVVTERERVCEPLPHDFVHASYALQAETAQSTGHASSLHDCVSER